LIEAPPTRYEIYPKFLSVEEDANKQLDPQKLAEIMDAWSGRRLLSFSKDIDMGNADSLVGGSIVNENYFQNQQQQQLEDNYVEVEYEVQMEKM
jgi:hypothetical protein